MSRPETFVQLSSLSPSQQDTYCRAACSFGGYTVYIEGEALYGVFDGNAVRHPLDPAKRELRIIPFDNLYISPSKVPVEELIEV